MRQFFTPALCTLAGIAIGGLAVQGLHAQAKPPVYYVGEITVTNPDAYAKEFASKAQPIIKAHGGRFLAIGGAGGAGAGKVTAIEGDAPPRATIIVWDSMDKLMAWRNDPQFQELLKIGNQYAKFHAFAIDGLPQ